MAGRSLPSAGGTAMRRPLHHARSRPHWPIPKPQAISSPSSIVLVGARHGHWSAIALARRTPSNRTPMPVLFLVGEAQYLAKEKPSITDPVAHEESAERPEMVRHKGEVSTPVEDSAKGRRKRLPPGLVVWPWRETGSRRRGARVFRRERAAEPCRAQAARARRPPAGRHGLSGWGQSRHPGLRGALPAGAERRRAAVQLSALFLRARLWLRR